MIPLSVKRSKFELKLEVLKAVSETYIQTKIMFKANLNYKILRKTLDSLISAKLIKVETVNNSLPGRISTQCIGNNKLIKHRYYLTDLGIETLRLINELEKIINGKGIYEVK